MVGTQNGDLGASDFPTVYAIATFKISNVDDCLVLQSLRDNNHASRKGMGKHMVNNLQDSL